MCSLRPLYQESTRKTRIPGGFLVVHQEYVEQWKVLLSRPVKTSYNQLCLVKEISKSGLTANWTMVTVSISLVLMQLFPVTVQSSHS